MTESQYLESVFAMLGQPESRHADPAAWETLECELGVELPVDYKAIIDGYGPVKLNGHLNLDHPAAERWNLRQAMQRDALVWSEVPWEEIELDTDPRPSLGISDMKFGTPDGLIYAVGTNRDEAIFLGKGTGPQGWRVFVARDDDFFEYPMPFAEWLYRYLVGEDMAGPNSSAFVPGPVMFESLPMSANETVTAWYGPDRGM
ncbi:putative hypothetical protein [Streptomyces sp. NBRC 110611]|uniref:hypothetical protein n=1 Tax=Streptomyces sp. NBRC 110611 TaxID=1621259 RepID=UPI0008327EA3|nr:hypothetical protein [Streptomyces sp. NBRC 110611]GAU69155.1 putative hypothetical protein [Streptomyces sp. NBRC 110611]